MGDIEYRYCTILFVWNKRYYYFHGGFDTFFNSLE